MVHDYGEEAINDIWQSIVLEVSREEEVGFPGASGKEPTCQCRRPKRHGFDPWVGKIPWRKGMTTHSSILACRIPWTEELGGLQSIGSQSQTPL